MKADKGNCFVVLDKCDYDCKMDSLLSDPKTYEIVAKSPFKKIERELNKRLLTLKKQHKINDSIYRKLHSSDATPPAMRGSINPFSASCIFIFSQPEPILFIEQI